MIKCYVEKKTKCLLIVSLATVLMMASAEEEQSMEIGTQSQSQMDTDTQKTVTDEEEKSGTYIGGQGDCPPIDAAKSAAEEGVSTSNGAEVAAKEGDPVVDVGVVDQEEVEEEEDEEYKFPKTLEGFNYAFNEEGQMRHIETNEPFEFKVKTDGDEEYNQKRYEALGEVITNHVYDLLENEVKLKKVYVPVDGAEDEPQSFIFMTEDALTNPDKLVLLIHGSGVVRAGQWARRLIINDCLKSGTQIPFIRRSMEEGYGVIVLNTNENSVHRGGKVIPIRENSFPEEHTLYVWETFVSKAAAKHIAIIAHSYGGVVTVELVNEKETEVKERVFAIALTDSVHSLVHQEASHSVIRYFKQVARNWVSSKEPLDTPQESRNKYDCPRVSAGTPRHEQTSWNSFDSIFSYLSEKYTDVLERDNKDEL